MTRLDRIEADLEIIKEILLTTASRTESTDKRIDDYNLVTTRAEPTCRRARSKN